MIIRFQSQIASVDTEPPRVISCNGPKSDANNVIYSTEKEVHVNWTEPTFSDNSGEKLTTYSTAKADMTTSNAHLVEYDEEEEGRAPIGQFLENSKLHGLRHFTSTSITVRVIWVLLVLFSIGAIIYNIQDVMVKFANYPVKNNIRSIHSDFLEFPVVTICNRNNFKQSVASAIPEVFQKYGGMMQLAMFNNHSLSDVYRDVNYYNWSDPELISFNTELTEKNWIELLNSVGPTLNETFMQCN